MEKGYELVTTTVDHRDKAYELASLLVERKLAACVQILGPMSSIYRWQGKIHHEQEHLLLIKTRSGMIGSIQEVFKTAHPYEVPELVGWAIEAGSDAYRRWMDENIIR